MSDSNEVITDIVIDIHNKKLTKDVFPSKSCKIVGFVIGNYTGQSPFRTSELKLTQGCQFAIPFSRKLKNLLIQVLAIDGSITILIGSAEILDFDKVNLNPRQMTLDIISGSNEVGKLHVIIYLRKKFPDSISSNRRKAVEKGNRVEDEFKILSRKDVVPNFMFRRLGRKINWERIRSLNLTRIVDLHDGEGIMTTIDDVALGDVAEEDADPRLLVTLQAAQYITQYMVSSQQLLEGKVKVINKALRVFSKEEELLDLKLAKMRARVKAQQREVDSVEQMVVEYEELLQDLNPELAYAYDMRTKRKVAKKVYDRERRIHELELQIEEKQLQRLMNLEQQNENVDIYNIRNSKTAKGLLNRARSLRNDGRKKTQFSNLDEIDELENDDNDVSEAVPGAHSHASRNREGMNAKTMGTDESEDTSGPRPLLRKQQTDTTKPSNRLDFVQIDSKSGQTVRGAPSERLGGAGEELVWREARQELERRESKAGNGSDASTGPAPLQAGKSNPSRFEMGGMGAGSDSSLTSSGEEDDGMLAIRKGMSLRRMDEGHRGSPIDQSNLSRADQKKPISDITASPSKPPPRLLQQLPAVSVQDVSSEEEEMTSQTRGSGAEWPSTRPSVSKDNILTASLQKEAFQYSDTIQNIKGLAGGTGVLKSTFTSTSMSAMSQDSLINDDLGPPSPFQKEGISVTSTTKAAPDRLRMRELINSLELNVTAESNVLVSSVSRKSANEGISKSAQATPKDSPRELSRANTLSVSDNFSLDSVQKGFSSHEMRESGNQTQTKVIKSGTNSMVTSSVIQQSHCSMTRENSNLLGSATVQKGGVSSGYMSPPTKESDDVLSLELSLNDSHVSELDQFFPIQKENSRAATQQPMLTMSLSSNRLSQLAANTPRVSAADIVIQSPEVSFDNDDEVMRFLPQSKFESERSKLQETTKSIRNQANDLFASRGNEDVTREDVQGTSSSQEDVLFDDDIKAMMRQSGSSSQAVPIRTVSYQSDHRHDAAEDEDMVLVGTSKFNTRSTDNNLNIPTITSFGEEDNAFDESGTSFNDDSSKRIPSPVVMDDDLKNKLSVIVDYANEEVSGAAIGPVTWQEGRARDAVETSQGLELLIHTIKLSAETMRTTAEICVRAHFLGGLSTVSPAIALGSTNHIFVNYTAHLRFDERTGPILSESIREQREQLALQILVLTIHHAGLQVYGVASLSLRVMIEDNVNMLREELDIFSIHTSECIGIAVVDVRGYQVLKKYSS